MTDDDFDKVDEDFASEFDFVDTQEGTTTGPQANQPAGGSGPGGPNQPPKGSPAIVSLMVLISILGGGYYVYTHFFSKPASTGIAPPTADKAKNSDIPTLPEHAAAPDLIEAPNGTAPTTPPMTAGSTSKDTANAIADALGKQGNDLSSAIPMSPPAPTGEKSFEQMQKEIHNSQPNVHQQAAQPAAVSAEVRAALQNISEEMTMNVNNIKQLESTISNMATTLDHLNRTISAMDNRVLSLTETVDGLSQDLANVKRVMVDQDLDLTLPGNVKASSGGKKQAHTISNSEPNYGVHAIIPGRAWLKAASGQIITVTEGDKIGDFGTVAVIDAANGLVRTSSGIIIR